MTYKPQASELLDRSRAEFAVLSHLVSVCGDEETARVVLALIPDDGLEFFACLTAEAMTSQLKTGLAPTIKDQWVETTPSTSSSSNRDHS